jgi:hypothetical protein
VHAMCGGVVNQLAALGGAWKPQLSIIMCSLLRVGHAGGCCACIQHSSHSGVKSRAA